MQAGPEVTCLAVIHVDSRDGETGRTGKVNKELDINFEDHSEDNKRELLTKIEQGLGDILYHVLKIANICNFNLSDYFRNAMIKNQNNYHTK